MSPIRILIVEDQPTAREVLKGVAAMAVSGARVQAVGDLEQGLETGTERAPDLVLLDLGLPGCQGVQAVERIRGAFPQAIILVVSCHDDRDTVNKALRAGANSFVPKGLSPAGIAAVLRGVPSC